MFIALAAQAALVKQAPQSVLPVKTMHSCWNPLKNFWI